MKVLLVEPNYRNKYPPMGLMKISTYHKSLGDEVHFVKGFDPGIDGQVWDRIYVTSLFTFDFDITVETINHYLKLVDNIDSLYVGGIMASLKSGEVTKATGIDASHILTGLFTDTSVVGDDNDINVDLLPLDYDILEETTYRYPAGDNYFAHITRGCPNHCPFCAVPVLEPEFRVTNNLVRQIETVDRKYGSKRNLILLDNNVLNTPDLKVLVDDLCAAGFERGAKYVDPGDYMKVMQRYKAGDRAAFLDVKLRSYLDSLRKRIKNEAVLDEYLQIILDSEEAPDYAQFMLDHEEELKPIVDKYRNKAERSRYLDFNQGLDARLINDENMEQLARLAIRPLRIAFDDIGMKGVYSRAVRTACRHGITDISTYVLFNYRDTPTDLYERLRVNIDLNKELGIHIVSFPMRYCPTDRTDRHYVGENWKYRKYLLAVSAILQATRGIVAAGPGLFDAAFGATLEEFYEILAMPREMIIHRSYYVNNGTTAEWKDLYRALTEEEKDRLLQLVSRPANELRTITSPPEEFKEILPFYLRKYAKDSPAHESPAKQLSFLEELLSSTEQVGGR